MVKILLNKILEGVATEFSSLSTQWDLGTRFFERDTNTWYILEQTDSGPLWQNQSPVELSASTVSTKFIPFTDQTGLTFGNGYWTGISAILLLDGSMIYRAGTSATVNNTNGSMGVDDYAFPTMLPKVEMKFVIDDNTTNTSLFIGFLPTSFDSATITTAAYIPTATPCFGMGARKTDTNWQLVFNDASGALNLEDLGVSRDTDLHTLLIQFTTSTSVTLTLKNESGTVLASVTKTSQIPSVSTAMLFAAEISNANTTRRYYIWMYDHIYLEKKVPVATGDLSF